jgi:hypothetical protein
MMVVTTLEMMRNTTFIRLNMLTQPPKSDNEGDKQWVNDILSGLKPKKLKFFNFEFGQFQFGSYSFNCF